MKLRWTIVWLILLIVGMLAGCAAMTRIEQGTTNNGKALEKNQMTIEQMGKKITDLQNTVATVDSRLATVEETINGNSTANTKELEKIAELDAQIKKLQKCMENGSAPEAAAAEKTVNDAITSGHYKVTLTVKRDKGVNVRNSPSTNGKILRTLKGGEIVYLEKIEKSWGHLAGENAWMTINTRWCQLKMIPMN